MTIAHGDLTRRITELACDAGESGFPLVEIGLTLIVRAGRFSLPVRSLLCSIGTIQLTLCELLIDDEKGNES